MNRILTLGLAALMTGSLMAAPANDRQGETAGKPIATVTTEWQQKSDAPLYKAPDGRAFAMQVSSLSMRGTKFKAPQRVTAGGGHIYGLAPQGWPVETQLWELTDDSVELVWTNSQHETNMSTCFFLDGKLCGPALIMNGMGIYGGYWREYDFKTGEILVNEEWNLYEDPIYEQVAYNPADGYVYGQAQWIPYGQGVLYVKASPYDMKHPTVLATRADISGYLTGICYNGDDNAIYAFNQYGQLITIDSDGTINVKYQVDLSSQNCDWIPSWMTAMAYDATDGLIYFCPLGFEHNYLATINPSTGEAIVYNTNDQAQMQSMFSTDAAYYNALMPKAPELLSLEFGEGSTNGTGKYLMPDEYVDGATITAGMTAIATIDGNNYGSYNVSAGETLTVKFEGLESGYHTFRLSVKAADVESYAAVNALFVGYDTPVAPANVVLDKTTVRWDAVTTGIYGGYIPANDIVYEVFLNGKSVGSTKDTKLDIKIDENAPIDFYTADVIATYVDPLTGKTIKSEAGVSNSIAEGKPYEIPFEVTPTANQAALCAIIDNNQDGVKWEYIPEENAFNILNSYGIPGDDWLILMPFTVNDATKTYSLSFDVCKYSTNYPYEYMEVFIGTAPSAEAMTTCIMPKFCPEGAYQGNVVTKFYMPSFAAFNVPTEGTYYIGFHAVSDPEQLGLWIKDIKVEDNNVTDNSPIGVSDYVVTAGEKGVLNATVTLTLPTKTRGGGDIPADSNMELVLMCNDYYSVATGKPGESVSATVSTHQGDNALSFYTSADGNKSVPQSTMIYTGQDIPAAPQNVRAEVSPDLNTVLLTWDPVTEGLNGCYIDPAGVDYHVMCLSNYAWDEFPATKETEFLYQCPADRPVHQATIGVRSSNVAGDNWTLMAAYVYIGTPYTLPIEENFSSEATGSDLTPWITYLPVEGESVEFGMNYLDRLGDYDSDGNIVLYMAGNPGATGMIGVPYFSTEGVESATATFTMNTGIDFPDMTLCASIDGRETMIEVAQIPATSGEEFTTMTFSLPEELMGQPVVALFLSCTIEKEDQIFILTNMSIDGKTSGVDEINNSGRISSGKGNVLFDGFDGQTATVYSLDGATVMNEVINGNHTQIGLNKGIYIVKAGNRRVKVVVK